MIHISITDSVSGSGSQHAPLRGVRVRSRPCHIETFGETAMRRDTRR
jgi:hypothetical protein